MPKRVFALVCKFGPKTFHLTLLQSVFLKVSCTLRVLRNTVVRKVYSKLAFYFNIILYAKDSFLKYTF